MPEPTRSRSGPTAQGRTPPLSSATAADRRDALLSQVAVRYYIEHETQDEIAQAIGRSVATVSRLLSRAEDAGVVEMDVAQPHALVPALQAALVKRFGLRVARVVHVSPAETHTIVPRIGDFAARYLSTILTNSSTLTMTWGSHSQAVALALPAMSLRDAHVVQGIGSRGATKAQLVLPRLVQSVAMRLEATPHFLPAPLITATVAERDAIARDPYFGKVLARIAESDVALIGVGSMFPPHASLYRAGVFDEWELEQIRGEGAVGELLAEFFDVQGRMVCTDISRRVVGMREAQMRQTSSVVALAGGEERAAAILGALRTGIVHVLVTDSVTTRAVLALADEYPAPVLAAVPSALPAMPAPPYEAEPDADPERDAILRATLRELDRVGYQKLSPTVVAQEAHVAPDRIYRCWGSRARLVGDAWRLRQAYARCSGATLREDLERLLRDVPQEEAVTGVPYVAARTMAAEAQLDPDFAPIFDDLQRVAANYVQGALARASQRGELALDADLDILAEMVSGAIWYRLLFARLPLDKRFAGTLTDMVLNLAGDYHERQPLPQDSARTERTPPGPPEA